MRGKRLVYATFFVVGKQVKYHPELIVRLQQEGHEIGNHTYSHKSLRHLSVDAQRSEILSVQELLRKLGVHLRYIRRRTEILTPTLWR
ncbi:MAG: polysaccharide deacetylase family protein [Bilophila wadsworthia]